MNTDDQLAVTPKNRYAPLEVPNRAAVMCHVNGHSPAVLPTSPPKYRCTRCGCMLEPNTRWRTEWVEK